MPDNEHDLISTDPHEIDYLLRYWDKAVNAENRMVLTEVVRGFLGDETWGPHNRQRFFEYDAGKGIQSQLEQAKGTDGSETIIHREELLHESNSTVIRVEQASERTFEMKSTFLPLLLIILGAAAISVILLFIIFSRPFEKTSEVRNSGMTAIIEKEKHITEAGTEVKTGTEAETGGGTEMKAEADTKTGNLVAVSESVPGFQELAAIVRENSPLLFIGDEITLLPGESIKLDNIIRSFDNYKKITLVLTGHAANVQMPDMEMRLGRNRALVIKDYLENHVRGCELIISTLDKGSTEPVVSNVPVIEQQPNRRVEIEIISAE